MIVRLSESRERQRDERSAEAKVSESVERRAQEWWQGWKEQGSASVNRLLERQDCLLGVILVWAASRLVYWLLAAAHDTREIFLFGLVVFETGNGLVLTIRLLLLSFHFSSCRYMLLRHPHWLLSYLFRVTF